MGEFFGLPYDYYSVMHYHSSAFSNCGWSCITIQTLDEKMQSASTTYSHLAEFTFRSLEEEKQLVRVTFNL